MLKTSTRQLPGSVKLVNSIPEKLDDDKRTNFFTIRPVCELCSVCAQPSERPEPFVLMRIVSSYPCYAHEHRHTLVIVVNHLDTPLAPHLCREAPCAVSPNVLVEWPVDRARKFFYEPGVKKIYPVMQKIC